MKDIIVIESPNKVKKISEYTGVEVFATVGHFKDLPVDDMGIDLNTYEPKFLISTDKKNRISTIKTAAEKNRVYIATDPDREGYAIGSFLYKEIAGVAGECWRLEIREITEKGIAQAMKEAVRWEDTNNGEFDAFLGRRLGDRLCGYLLSPQANTALNGKYSVGRVQSPAVRLVVDREREIKNFKTTPYFTIAAQLKANDKTFKAQFDGYKDDSKSFQTEEEAKTAIVDATIAKYAIVETVENKVLNRSPKAPFTTVDLQAAASISLSISPEKSMELAQGLFEAGLITYHRTDSVRLSDDFLQEAADFVNASFGSEFVPAKPKKHTSKNSQADAHEAIRPTHLHPIDEIDGKIKEAALTADHAKLYGLIFKRAVSSMMADATFDSTTYSFDIGGLPFKASGSIPKFAGWMVLYKEDTEEDLDTEKEQDLPVLLKNDSCEKISIDIESKTTKAPSRYTEASLIKALEKMGIGRPSTYASIMQTIKKREYITIEKKKLRPSERGEILVDWLNESNPWVIDYKFTADMENYLDKVEEKSPGATWQLFCKDIHQKMDFFKPSSQQVDGPPSTAQIEYAKKIAEKNSIILNDDILSSRQAISKWIDKHGGGSKKSSNTPVGSCGCGEEIKEWDKSFQCKGCKSTIWKEFFGKKITKAQAINLLNKKTIELKGLIGKSEKPFDAKAEFKDGKINLIFEK